MSEDAISTYLHASFPLVSDPYELMIENLDKIQHIKNDFLGVADISSDVNNDFFQHRDDGFFNY